MAQEDYFSSQTGQLAGTLLARGKDKDDAGKAIVLSLIQQFASNAKAGLKQSVLDGSKEVANKWNDIMASMTSDYNEAASDRSEVKQYLREGDKFLNKKALENIDSITAAMGSKYTYATRFDDAVSPEMKKNMEEAFNQEKKDLAKGYDIMLEDPKINMSNRVDYLNPALKAFREADKAVMNDPTKRNLLTSVWNKYVNTERNNEGELVTTNAKKLKLINNAEAVEKVYLDQAEIEAAATLKLDNYYKNSIGLDNVQEIKNQQLVKAPFYTTEKRLQARMLLNNKFLYTKDTKNKVIDNEDYYKSELNIKLNVFPSENTDEKQTNTSQVINIKEDKFNNIVVLNNSGELEPFSKEIFMQIVAEQQEAIVQASEKNKTTPITGKILFETVLKNFGNQGRFISANKIDDRGYFNKIIDPKEIQFEANSIIFMAPGGDFITSKKTDSSDAVAIHSENSDGEGSMPRLNANGEEIEEYSSTLIEAIFESKQFAEASSETRVEQRDARIYYYPEHEEKIIALYNIAKNKNTWNNVPAEKEIKKEIETKVKPVETFSLLAPRDLSNTLSSEEMNKKMDEGISRMSEDSVSLGQILRMDKESTRKRVIKKAEKYLENPKSFFSSSIFSKWVKETKGIEAYKIKKEDKPKAVEEFLEFLNQ